MPTRIMSSFVAQFKSGITVLIFPYLCLFNYVVSFNDD